MILIKNFVSKNNSETLSKAILEQKKFDDFVMDGRNRINKGSKNFIKFVSKKQIIKKFYNKINQKSFFNKIKYLFEKEYGSFPWKIENNFKKFSKHSYGLQKGNKFTKESKRAKKYNIVNLDFDFSISENGYAREPHRDRETRIINFLVYLNSVPKKDGGALTMFAAKKFWGTKIKDFPRYPNEKKVRIIKKFQPKKGNAIFFMSSPNSYHGVTKFYNKNNNKRIFIYGSFSLNKPVTWKFKKNLEV